eukprot:CAMPEP_0113948354 /NCGR_PEP_ID=MMETSP1339-20121228/69914_1 /TAXON_ID=94617 /ORGANISM="Fibrocapsa japonica" /LENGTH=91 /DNA_ID=CAMNT_0000955387 /DNA_START=107 /DNA_END=379 /DNA_ORIENTATION=- /assembly_acc=CAM_ASM_000762
MSGSKVSEREGIVKVHPRRGKSPRDMNGKSGILTPRISCGDLHSSSEGGLNAAASRHDINDTIAMPRNTPVHPREGISFWITSPPKILAVP